jgi:hypothetical protein
LGTTVLTGCEFSALVITEPTALLTRQIELALQAA